jgi:hypothetical protein
LIYKYKRESIIKLFDEASVFKQFLAQHWRVLMVDSASSHVFVDGTAESMGLKGVALVIEAAILFLIILATATGTVLETVIVFAAVQLDFFFDISSAVSVS